MMNEEKKYQKHDDDTKARDLGDLMRIGSVSEDMTSPSENLENCPDESVKEKNDLGNLMGLGQTSGEESMDEEAPSGDQKIPESSHHKAYPFGAHPATEQLCRTNDEDVPALWMFSPGKFPLALESFRSLKNKIVALKGNENLSVFLITGASGKVGISTVTFNLGLILGMDLSEKRILLVDANLRNPSLDKVFGISPEPGLMDHFFEGRSLSDVIQASPVPNLDLLPVGQSAHQLMSPFDMEEFSSFIEEVKNNYDFVLIDSEPALQSSRTRMASSKVDGVIIVAEVNRTRLEVISELKRQLEIDGVRIAGCFLNKRIFVIPRWVYRFI